MKPSVMKIGDTGLLQGPSTVSRKTRIWHCLKYMVAIAGGDFEGVISGNAHLISQLISSHSHWADIAYMQDVFNSAG